MMKHIIFFLIFVISIRVTHAQRNARNVVPYDPNKKYSVKELQFDLAILKDALVKIHPGLFWYQSEKEFEGEYNRVNNSINGPMTEREFFILIAPFVALVRCGHTDIVLSEMFDSYFTDNIKIFPFKVKIINSKIYLIQNYTDDKSITMGSEIISINGISTDSILRFMKPYAWEDGFIESYARIEVDFEPLIVILGLFDNPKMYSLSVTDPSGNSRLIETQALDQKTRDLRYAQRYETDLRQEDKPYKFSIIDSLSTALIKLDVFHGKGYETFFKRSFKTMKDSKIKNLIIDLRNNGGGDVHYSRLLYSYISLKDYNYYKYLELTVDNPNDSIFKYGKMEDGMLAFKFFNTFKVKEIEKGKYFAKSYAFKDLGKKPFHPDKNNFIGNVFILMNEKSFSAASGFCAVTQYNKRAECIGHETGGGYCGGGGGFSFLLSLPNTGIRVTIPVVKYRMAVEGPCGRGVQPNHILKYNIKDYIDNKDSDLLFTLELINKNK